MGASLAKMSADDFLEWERKQEGRHEFVDGQVYAMAGASRGHVQTTLNLAQAMRELLRGRPCLVMAVDMRLHLTALKRFFYPDVFVTCSDRDRQADDVMYEPSVIFEVLSPSTESYDRGDKFWAYRQITTLQEYVLIDPLKLRIEIYRRSAGHQHWAFHGLETGQELRLQSMNISIAWAKIFDGVESPSA
jgi:Uma2 family endonuclease